MTPGAAVRRNAPGPPVRRRTGAHPGGPGMGSAPSSIGARPSHYAPKAKSVIFLYMDGGPAQMDTFDPKPALAQRAFPR